jgi:hypothetical protein
VGFHVPAEVSPSCNVLLVTPVMHFVLFFWVHRGNEPVAGPGKYPVKRLHGVLPGVLASPGRCPLSRGTDRSSRGREVQCSESNTGQDFVQF